MPASSSIRIRAGAEEEHAVEYSVSDLPSTSRNELLERINQVFHTEERDGRAFGGPVRGYTDRGEPYPEADLNPDQTADFLF